VVNRVARTLCALLIGSCLAIGVIGQSENAQTTVTGFVTDTLSGRHGANALHVAAAKRNVASGMAQYALYDEKTHKLYILASQDLAVAYLGQRLKITGTLASTPLNHASQMVNPNTNAVMNFYNQPGQDSSTPIAGILTIVSMTQAPLAPPTHPASN